MLAVLFGELFGFRTHAAENFNARDHVVAIEPVIEGIFTTAEQDGTVAFFCKDTVEIVYPERNAAPSKENKRDKETGTDSIDAPPNTGIDCRLVSRDIRKLL